MHNGVMTNGVLIQVGKKIDQIMKQQGLTQFKLAELSGIKRQNISDYINGKRNASLKTLQRIAAALNVPVKQLID